MTDLESFLASVSIFKEVPLEQLTEIAPLFRQEHFAAGTVILYQGRQSVAVYFLRSGRLAVRVQRPEGRETVAYLQPGAMFGELSFITGRTCSANVEVVVDADVVSLPKEALAKLPKQRDAILRGMMTLVAERLHDTVTRGTRAANSPVILLRNAPGWQAPVSFGVELARSLGRQTGRETLVVNLGAGQVEAELASLGEHCSRLDLRTEQSAVNLRSHLAERLTGWKQRFANVVLNPLGTDAKEIYQQSAAFADYCGDLLGPGDAVVNEAGPKRFVVQSADRPTLDWLGGNCRLAWDAAESEMACFAGTTASPRFLRVTDSIARFIADTQVGIALGGGAAWGWAHIGVLSVLENAGLPIDVVAGCSMGTVIGTLRCAGRSVEELREIANYWRNRTRRFVEYRVWRMHLLKEQAIRRAFAVYFGDRQVNQMEIPFWANAVDIGNGKEFTIRSGSTVDALRASISLPGLLPPFDCNGHMLVDAGIMNPVPVNLIRRMGCRFAIAVNAMAPLESAPLSKRYPINIFDVMFRCTRIMGHEIGQAAGEAAADIMMTPPMHNISMLQFDRSEEIIDCGRRVAEQNLPAILAGYERLRTSEPTDLSSEKQMKI
jgi:NTE family protein